MQNFIIHFCMRELFFSYRFVFAPFLLLAICTLIALLQLNAWVEFNRSAILQGQVWRFLSGNFAHSNWLHLLFNAFGVLVLWALHAHYIKTPFAYWWRLGVLSLTCTGAIFLLDPDIQFYVGLSGVLHGLIVWGACWDIKSHERTGYLILAGVALKIGYEQTLGVSVELESLIAASVAVDAHLYGACAGLLLGVIETSRFVTQRNKTRG